MQQLERFQPRTHRFFRIMVPWYVSKISSHIFPIFPCLFLESHSLLYSSSYLSSSMETAHQLHHHHHHHRQRSWCPAQEAALVPCIEPTFPNSSSDKILTKESFELRFRYNNFRLGYNTLNKRYFVASKSGFARRLERRSNEVGTHLFSDPSFPRFCVVLPWVAPRQSVVASRARSRGPGRRA